jgi:myo-inositol-1(or 4)-monophosphatase
VTTPKDRELRDLAISVATEAGALALRRRREGVEVAATKSSAVDVVTAADREVEALIRTRIASARPQDAFLGEEFAAAAGSSGLTWVVDPIDGTVNYLYDIPRWAVSVAVVEGDDPSTWTALAGCVVNPSVGEVYAAARGQGATRDGIPVSVGAADSLSTSLVATGFAYDAATRVEQAAAAARVIGSVRDLRRAGAAALDLCDVASARLDAYWERGLMPWDFAAGALIATEAGAVVTVGDVRGGRRLVTAAAPGIADEFGALVHGVGA